MSVPRLSYDEIRKILNDDNIIDIGPINKGGQKLVVQVRTKEKEYLVKFIQMHSFGARAFEDEISNKEDATFGRLRREINILKTCNCSYLVKILSSSLEHVTYNGNDIFYYAEELINGADVQTLLDSHHKFSIFDVINLSLCINSAIASLWQHSIIHRDIKPQNIIFDNDNNKFVLIDPGIAFDLQDISYTQAGAIVGTATFMSPEQLNPNSRRSLDFRSDHFLLGICMYYLLTNEHPFYFEANSIYDVHANIIKKKHRLLIDINKEIPIKLSKIVDRLLAKEPHMRYRNTSLLELDLLQVKSMII